MDSFGPPAQFVSDRLRILYVGQVGYDGTCQHRRDAMCQLGHVVESLSTASLFGNAHIKLLRNLFGRLGHFVDVRGTNRHILDSLSKGRWNVLWVDKGLIIHPATLQQAKLLQPGLVCVSYSPDDMLNPKVSTRRYYSTIPYYDLHVTTKTYNVPELQQLGARRVLFVHNAYNPAVHRPLPVSDDDRKRLGAAPVGFVGQYEDDRVQIMETLAQNGIPLVYRCYSRWPVRHPRPRHLRVIKGYVAGDDYARFICACRINLGFLHKGNRDQQTTRSMEIPACGGFLLAERTNEHQALFEEGREAEFFSSGDELLDKVKFYLANEKLRKKIATAGRQRCLRSGYDNLSVITSILKQAVPGSQ